MIPMGKMLQQLRREKKWTQEKFGEGITSKSVISRIETGLKEADIFLLDALVAKLGQSLRYFEIVVTEAEYQKFVNMGGTEENQKMRNAELPGLEDKIVISEAGLLRDIRKEREWTQEQLSENVCARETISNMENGRKPNHKKWKELMLKLGELHYTYYGYVVATEFSVYELVESYQKMEVKHCKEAKELLRKIKKCLDMSHPVNRQFFEASELIAKFQGGELEAAETMAALEKCLRYTMPEYDGIIHRVPHCEESVILELIVQCMALVNRTEAAEELARMLRKKNGKKLKVSGNVTDL